MIIKPSYHHDWINLGQISILPLLLHTIVKMQSIRLKTIELISHTLFEIVIF